MKWMGYVACIGEVINAYKIHIGEPEGKKKHLEELGMVDGRIILKQIL
jgi:hypothetical protein